MFALEIDPATIEIAASGSITGAIWLHADDIAFPETDWNDFVVVVLGWWTNEAAALIAGGKTRGELMFMDGPFSVSIVPHGDAWKLDCFRRKRNGTALEHSFLTEAVVLADALVRAAD